MGESAKALLGGLILLCAVGELMLFAVGVPSTPVVWIARVIVPLVIVAAGTTWIWAARRKDLAPDFLRQLFKNPFERDGVCFMVFPAVNDGVAYLNVVFQNQYASDCDFRVVVSPPLKSFSFGKRQFDGVAVDVRCEGGALGVIRAPLGIPLKFQGKSARFDVSAATQYSQGRGELLRFRNGLRVGKADTSGMGSAAVTVALLALGHIHYSRPASISLQLPGGVAEQVPPSHEAVAQTLWKPGEPADDIGLRVQQSLAAT